MRSVNNELVWRKTRFLHAYLNFSSFSNQTFTVYIITYFGLCKNVAEGMHTCIVCYVPTIIHYYKEFQLPKNIIRTYYNHEKIYKSKFFGVLHHLHFFFQNMHHLDLIQFPVYAGICSSTESTWDLF